MAQKSDAVGGANERANAVERPRFKLHQIPALTRDDVEGGVKAREVAGLDGAHRGDHHGTRSQNSWLEECCIDVAATMQDTHKLKHVMAFVIGQIQIVITEWVTSQAGTQFRHRSAGCLRNGRQNVDCRNDPIDEIGDNDESSCIGDPVGQLLQICFSLGRDNDAGHGALRAARRAFSLAATVASGAPSPRASEASAASIAGCAHR